MPTTSFLTDQDLKDLETLGSVEEYAAKAVILEQSMDCDAVYWMLEGVVQVDFHQLYNNDVLAYLGPGDLFGEMSYLLGGNTSAAVVATQPVKLVRIPFSELAKLVDTRPELAARFYKTLAHTLAGRLRAQIAR
ncbi:MAG: cyclic nucleotide-binding domain-containing protein [Pseudomonadota bacterium]